MLKNVRKKLGHRYGSFEYRKEADLIRTGGVSSKYTRILPFVPGRNVFEVGAAEGVLSLLLAERKDHVFGVEKVDSRHQQALALQNTWRELGFPVDNCEMLLGDVRDHYDKLDSADTVVAVRSIYYLKDDLDDVFSQFAARVSNVVLCGNRSRSVKYFENRGTKAFGDTVGHYNYYASLDGMWNLVTRHGFRVVHAVPDGDPIVVASR